MNREKYAIAHSENCEIIFFIFALECARCIKLHLHNRRTCGVRSLWISFCYIWRAECSYERPYVVGRTCELSSCGNYFNWAKKKSMAAILSDRSSRVVTHEKKLCEKSSATMLFSMSLPTWPIDSMLEKLFFVCALNGGISRACAHVEFPNYVRSKMSTPHYCIFVRDCLEFDCPQHSIIPTNRQAANGYCQHHSQIYTSNINSYRSMYV